MKKILLALSLLFLAACDSGDSDSGGGQETTSPGQNLPSNFVGTYIGTLTLTASALGLSETESAPITITVNSNGTVRFESDGADENFTAGITDAGNFTGTITINEDICTGTLNVAGMVDGTNATGTVEGDGECDDGQVSADVEIEGNFSATKQ